MSAEVGGVRELLPLLWKDATLFIRMRLVSVVSLVMAASILTGLGPIALKLAVDGFTGQTSEALFSPFLLIGLYVLSQWLARSIGEIRGLIYARAERRLFRSLSERLFAHIMQLPLRFHLERQTGAVCQTLENGLEGYQMILHHLVFTVLPVTVELGTIILVLTRLTSPIFLAMFCGALACYGVVFAYAAKTVAGSARAASAAHVEANAAMTDSILNYETVKYFTAESIVQEKVSKALGRTEIEWVGFFRRYAVNGLLVAAIFAVFLALSMIYAAHEVRAGRLTIGDFVLVNSYMLQLIRPVETLGYAMQGLSQGLAMLDKLVSLFREVPESQVTAGLASSGGAAELEFEAVSLSYRPDRSVLKAVSFKIAAGRTLGVVGVSGSGKSTLVRLLTRLIEPDCGRILLDGIPISALALGKLRQSIAVVPQDTVLFNDTIAYNIAFGRVGSTDEQIVQAAKLAHLHDFIMGLPEQCETRVGERGVKLSGGERQRVSIARAAIKKPLIYVFDEATSALDSRTEGEILSSLREVSSCNTTLVIAHRLSTVVQADEIVVLDNGIVVERGTHALLLGRGGHYAGLWAAQHSGTIAA